MKIKNPRNKSSNRSIKKAILAVTCCVILAGIGGAALFYLMPSKDAEPAAAEPVKEQTIMIGNGGDIIIHSPFYRSSPRENDRRFLPGIPNRAIKSGNLTSLKPSSSGRKSNHDKMV